MARLTARRTESSLRTVNLGKVRATGVQSPAKSRLIIFSLSRRFPVSSTIFGSSGSPTTRGAPFSNGPPKATNRQGRRSTLWSRGSHNHCQLPIADCRFPNADCSIVKGPIGNWQLAMGRELLALVQWPQAGPGYFANVVTVPSGVNLRML